MNDHYIILTEALIRLGMNKGAGLKAPQASLLHVPYPLKSGWLESLIGQAVSPSNYEQFLALRDAKKPKRESSPKKDKPLKTKPLAKTKKEAKASTPRVKRLRNDQKAPELGSHTFDEWVDLGYRVSKGMKSTSRNLDGKPLFGIDQVWKVPAHQRDKYLTPSKPVGLVAEVHERMKKGTSQYVPSTNAPGNAFDAGGFPTKDRMDYHMSQLNSNHRMLEALEDHLDQNLMSKYGDQFNDDLDDEPPW